MNIALWNGYNSLHLMIMITSIVDISYSVILSSSAYSGLLYMLVLSYWVCPGSCWWGDVIHYPEYVKWVEQFINNETPGTLLSAPPFYPVVQVILSKLVLGLSVPWRSRQGRGRMRMTMSQPSPTLSPGWQGAVVRSTRGWPGSQWGTSSRRGQSSGTVLGRTIWIDWTGIHR